MRRHKHYFLEQLLFIKLLFPREHDTEVLLSSSYSSKPKTGLSLELQQTSSSRLIAFGDAEMQIIQAVQEELPCFSDFSVPEGRRFELWMQNLALQLSLFLHVFVPIYLSRCFLYSVHFSSQVTYSTVHLLRAARISHERELSFLHYSFVFHIIIQKGPDKPVTCRILQDLPAHCLF